MHLELRQAIIRDFRPTDDESIAENANFREIWINMRDAFPHPYLIEDARAWLMLVESMNPRTNFALDVEGKAVGGIGLRMQEDVNRRSAEIGYWLGPAYWGRGIATEALHALTQYAFDNFDLCRIYAMVFSWNPSSAKVLEKCGYKQEARLVKSVQKDGKLTDSWLYAIVR